MALKFSQIKSTLDATTLLAEATSNVVNNVDGVQTLGTSNTPFLSAHITDLATTTITLGSSVTPFISTDPGAAGRVAVFAAQAVDFTAPMTTFYGNTTVNGDLVVTGSNFTTTAETVEIADNVLLLNAGEVGAGVSAGYAGLEVDRGAASNYLLVFDEATDMFRVGTASNLETLATQPFVVGTALVRSSNLSDLTSAGVARSNLGTNEASNITSGILDVARGGTGAVTATGSGSVVRSAAPTLTGTTIVAALVAATLSGAGAGITALDATNVATGTLAVARIADGSITDAKIADLAASKVTGVLPVATGGTGTTTATGTGSVVLSAGATLTGTTTAATLAATTLSGAGAGITALSATNIATGTLAVARIADGSVTDAKIAAVAASKVTGVLPVATGGTGTTTATGTGSVVLSAGATLTGTTLTGTTTMGDANVTGTTTTKDLTVDGNLVVSGSNFTSHSQTVTVSDNILVLNSGEAGSAVTAGTAGLRIDRGTGTAYEMVFDEAMDMFRVGMVGDMETLASHPYVASALKSNALNPGCNLNDLVDAVAARSNLGSYDTANILRGTLAVARGGTGTTTSTGTGSVVLNTSPTFTGTLFNLGALNTSSVVLTNSLAGADSNQIMSLAGALNISAEDVVNIIGDNNSNNSTSSKVVSFRYGGSSASNSAEVGYITGTGDALFTGSIGLGTPTPTQKLHVVGNVLATGSVTGATLAGNGSNITALHAGNVATGTLPVARGGTGVVTSTGTGSVVLSTGAKLAGLTTLGDDATGVDPTSVCLVNGYKEFHSRTIMKGTGGTGGNDVLMVFTGSSNANVTLQIQENGNTTMTGTTTVATLAATTVNPTSVVFPKTLADKKLVLYDGIGMDCFSFGVAANVLKYNCGVSSSHVFTVSNAELMRVNGVNGNVGIGTSAPTQKLHVVGNIFATGDVVAQSDARLKTDITLVDNAMARIGAISGYTYRMKSDETGRRCLGVLAQEVLAVMPEAVTMPPADSPDGYMSVAYGNLTALLIEGIKELGASVRDVSERLARLEASA